MHIPQIPSWIFSLLKLVGEIYNDIRLRNLEKHVEPPRAAARAHPGNLEWRVEFGTKEHSFYEKLVGAGLLMRSNLFSNLYRLPTRWH